MNSVYCMIAQHLGPHAKGNAFDVVDITCSGCAAANGIKMPLGT